MNDVPRAVAFYEERHGFDVGFTWGEPVTMAGVNQIEGLADVAELDLVNCA